MTVNFLSKVASCFFACIPLQVYADGLSVPEARAAAATGHDCALNGDRQCAFEYTHTALSSAAYIDFLWEDESHFHLAEWDWYIRYAFDAADELAPQAKRDVVELAIETIASRPNKQIEISTALLEVSRAEACFELGDGPCARSSAMAVAELEAGSPAVALSTDNTVAWYSQHSNDAPTEDEMRARVDAVLALVE